MWVLASYPGIVQNGVIHLEGRSLPDGAKVLVVAVEQVPAPVAEQVNQLQHMSLDEWRKPFEELIEVARKYPAEVDIDQITDDELEAIVQEVRAERVPL